MSDRFWIGGTGNWSDTSHWSTTSGGSGGASKPTSADNVYFDANSFTSAGQTVTVDETAYCLDMDWTGATNSPTLYENAYKIINIYGNLTFIDAMSLSGSTVGCCYFQGTSTGKTITTAGKTLFRCYFMNRGSWTLQDGLIVSDAISLSYGNLDTNSKSVSCASFSSASGTHLTLGSTVFTCSSGFTSSSGTVLAAGTSTIKLTGNSKTFKGGGLTYNDVQFSGTPTTVTGDNTFNTLTVDSGKTLNLTAGTTQTVTSLSVDGATLQSATSGSPATIACAKNITVHNATIKDIAAVAAWGDWEAKNSEDTIIPQGTDLTGYKVQWRVNLSTSDASVTPSLDDVTVAVTSALQSISGNRVTDPIPIVLHGQAASSSIAWTENKPDGTDITLELSWDNGETWLPCTNGGELPEITGKNLATASFMLRESLSTSDIGVTPALQSVAVGIVSDRQGVVVEEGTTNLCVGLGGDTYDLEKVYSADSPYCEIVTIEGKKWIKFRGSPYFALRIDSISISPNTTYTWSFLCFSERNGSLKLYHWDGSIYGLQEGIEISTTPTKITKTFTSNTSSAYEVFHIGVTDADTNYYFADFQLEQKPYATSWQLPGTARAPEVLTIPTAGVFNKGNWSVELTFTPRSLQDVTYNVLLQIYIDSNNYYNLTVGTEGFLGLTVSSGGVQKSINSATVLLVNQTYHIMISGNGNVIRLCINGVQIGVDTAYAEPVGDLPANIYIGSNSTLVFQANGIISDLRISSRARTLTEHQAAYNSGQPLEADDATTYLMSANGNLNVSSTPHWLSPVIDVSTATDKTSGLATMTAATPGGSSVAITSRSAPASTGPWTDWESALVDGSLQHTPDDFVQVMLTMTRSGEDDPYVDRLTVSFDGAASATLLADDFTVGGQYYFDQLNDLLAVLNGIDEPRKYDGDTLATMGGSPPHAPYGVAHKNRFWMAKGSRLYFSDLLDMESWPVLNFIDIMPNDGDVITGMLVYGDYLVLTKQHSTWMLLGDGTSTFRVKRIHADRGAYAPRSLCIVNQMLCMASDDGIYFSDFTQPVLVSERMKKTWARLNKRRLNTIACSFHDNKLYVAVPEGTNQRNNMLIVYDSLRQAFAGEFTEWPISCWMNFREGGQQNVFFGRSDRGNVTQINTGYNDNGAAINAVYISKAMSFGSSQIVKRWNEIYSQIKSSALGATLNVSFIIDGVETASMSVNITADPNGLIHSVLMLASTVGVIGGRMFQIKIQQAVLDNPVGIQELYIPSEPLYIQPTIRG